MSGRMTSEGLSPREDHEDDEEEEERMQMMTMIKMEEEQVSGSAASPHLPALDGDQRQQPSGYPAPMVGTWLEWVGIRRHLTEGADRKGWGKGFRSGPLIGPYLEWQHQPATRSEALLVRQGHPWLVAAMMAGRLWTDPQRLGRRMSAAAATEEYSMSTDA